jgi:hypothetical protein
MMRSKMSDTINGMELIKADVLTADALEVGDLISFDDDIVEVISIDVDSTGDIYSVKVSNDFGETTIVDFDFDEEVDWYVYLD